MEIRKTFTTENKNHQNDAIKDFGTSFSDKMFFMKYKEGKGWYDAEIKNFEPFTLSPASLVFHYSQEIFEGQKAYKWDDGSIVLFRPDMNIKRFNISAERICMPTIDEDFFMQALKSLVWENKNWIPSEEFYSLYIRPAMIATEPVLGVRSSSEYYFFIIVSPVGPYFSEGYKPVNILVSDYYVRAAVGGVGEAKTGGNYAASLKAMTEAKQKGFTQVLWLDANHKKYVEEVGTMNICFVWNGKLVTPEFTGSILNGITRDSVLILAKYFGIEVVETKIDINQICEEIKKGNVTECFGCGTACVISPVSGLSYKNTLYTINNGKIGNLTQKIYDELTGIQYGKVKDHFSWITKVYA